MLCVCCRHLTQFPMNDLLVLSCCKFDFQIKWFMYIQMVCSLHASLKWLLYLRGFATNCQQRLHIKLCWHHQSLCTYFACLRLLYMWLNIPVVERLNFELWKCKVKISQTMIPGSIFRFHIFLNLQYLHSPSCLKDLT